MNYNGLNAKVKAMNRLLLTDEDYANISKINSVEGFVLKLKEFHGYKEIAEDLTYGRLSRNILERKLALELSDEFYRIYSFIGDYNIRKFLDAYFIKREIKVLKFLLATILDERDNHEIIRDYKVFFTRNFEVDEKKLISSASVPELIENLTGTPYHKILNDVYYDSISLFQLEMPLDLYYYMNLWRQKDKYLVGENKKILSEIIGAEIDLTNILWIYRLKVYYSLESRLIYSYLIPIKHKLKAWDINRLIECQSPETLMQEIRNTSYGASLAEKEIDRAVFNKKNEMLRSFEIGKKNTLASAIAYMFRKETEIKNVVSILEGIRYGVSPDRVLEFLYKAF